MQKIILYVIGAITISIVGFYIGFAISKKIAEVKENSQKETSAEIKSEIISPINSKTTLVFVGDMMFDRGVKTSVNNNFDGDYNKLFENLNELKEADILFANLEGPVSDIGNNVGSKYSFRMDPNILPVIKNAGFDIVSFANNHVGDWNVKAFGDTLNRLDNIGILKTGAGINKEDAEKPVIIDKNGVKFGFLGFSDVGPAWMEAKIDKPGILLASDPRLPLIIQNAKVLSDVLIVSIHWGDEYKTIHNTRQDNLAKIAIDSGADMVIGHHPHVIEDVEIYKDKPIVYSLGNFIFDQYFSKNTMRGMLFSATFDGKNLTETEQKIITLNKKFQPEGIYTLDEMKERDKIIPFACLNPKKEYEDMSLSPIGQTLSLPDVTYIPKNLIELSSLISTRKGICLTKETSDSFEDMAESALKDGYKIKISSGFRSYEIQNDLFKNSIKNNGGSTSISVAKPGYSEHQLGTTADITGASINYSSAVDNFNNTPEDLWLKSNAYLYGFVQSYPLDKESITGYMYEPWHYRYVGVNNAKEIMRSGQTINEFLD
ncbi:MAG: CapA family protein [Candidatus Nomurabacteria bacterium]|nr:CapA family protein [Candidatus Nomurabacteria bacterium]